MELNKHSITFLYIKPIWLTKKPLYKCDIFACLKNVFHCQLLYCLQHVIWNI